MLQISAARSSYICTFASASATPAAAAVRCTNEINQAGGAVITLPKCASQLCSFPEGKRGGRKLKKME